MIDLKDYDYNKMDFARKKEWFKIKLGIQQFASHYFLNIIWVFLLIAILLSNHYLTLFLYSYFDFNGVNQIFYVFCGLITVLVPILFSILILQYIGELSARRDEAKLLMCFNKKYLEFGTPILVSKKRGKNKNIAIREFYTYIPKHIWEEQQKHISEVFNVRIMGIEYGKKPNRIVLISVKGRKSNVESVIYDEKL